MKGIFIILLLSTLFFIRCTEYPEPKPYSYSKLLTGENSKTWELVGLQFRENGKPPDSFVLPEDCIFDDYYVFYATSDKRFEVQEGPSKCAEEDPDVFITDKWSLTSGTATLEMVIPILANFRLPFIVQELTEKKLVVEIYFNDNNQSYRMIFNEVKTE